MFVHDIFHHNFICWQLDGRRFVATCADQATEDQATEATEATLRASRTFPPTKLEPKCGPQMSSCAGYKYANHGAGIWIPTFTPFLWASFVGKYAIYGAYGYHFPTFSRHKSAGHFPQFLQVPSWRPAMIPRKSWIFILGKATVIHWSVESRRMFWSSLWIHCLRSCG